MFITKEDLASHLRGEFQEAITRGDAAIIGAALDGAIAEARGYLSLYDTEAIFAAEGKARNALLLIFVKDIAVWHLINMTAPGAHADRRETRYKRAVEWLRAVQRGDVSPDLPRKPDEGGQSTGLVFHSSNPKREQHF